MPPPPDIDALSATELKSLVLKLLDEMADLRRTVALQRDEIARLKGGSVALSIPLGLMSGRPVPPKSDAERVADLERKAERIADEQRGMIADIKSLTKSEKSK